MLARVTNAHLRAGRALFSFLLVFSLLPVSAIPAGASLIGTVEVMPLGDSITVGVLGSSNDTGYRRELWLAQAAAGHTLDFVGSSSTGVPNDFDKRHEGHSGMRADQIRDGVTGWLNANPADVVLLHIGTNDITQGQSANSTANEIGQILDKIKAVDSTTWVIVAKVIPRNDGNSTLQQRTTDLNNRVANLVAARTANGDRVTLVDMNGPLNPSTDLADGIHPDDSGYSKMAVAWDSKLDELLVPDTTRPVITLSGANPQTLEAGTVYVEQGATATDNIDGDLTDEIVINASAVDTGALGSYPVTYDVSDSSENAAIQKIRTVLVVDTTRPVITLVGGNPQILEVGSAYIELGATATDSLDGSLSGSVIIDASAVDPGSTGSYPVTYNVSDSAGNSAIEKVRTVKVVDTSAPVITLQGGNPQTVLVGASYIELGANVADNQATPIAPLIDSSAVKVSVPGVYSVTYDATDASGNSATQLVRTVLVVPVRPGEAAAATLSGRFSSDGRTDLAVWYPTADSWWVGVSIGSGFAFAPWSNAGGLPIHTAHRVGDFDGDGRDDVAAFSRGTWWIGRSNGIGFSTAAWSTFSSASGWSSQVVGDFDGDGRDDVANFHPSNGTWWVSRSTGSGFVTSLWADFSTASGWSSQVVGDFDGDGRDDIANYHAAANALWISIATGSSFTTTRWD